MGAAGDGSTRPVELQTGAKKSTEKKKKKKWQWDGTLHEKNAQRMGEQALWGLHADVGDGPS